MKPLIVAMIFAFGCQTVFAVQPTERRVIEIQVTEKGFEPSSVEVKSGIPIVLKVTRKTDSTCAKSIQIPSKKIKRDLPLNNPVSIEVGTLDKGEVRFACGMDMVAGQILVR